MWVCVPNRVSLFLDDTHINVCSRMTIVDLLGSTHSNVTILCNYPRKKEWNDNELVQEGNEKEIGNAEFHILSRCIWWRWKEKAITVTRICFHVCFWRGKTIQVEIVVFGSTALFFINVTDSSLPGEVKSFSKNRITLTERVKCGLKTFVSQYTQRKAWPMERRWNMLQKRSSDNNDD